MWDGLSVGRAMRGGQQDLVGVVRLETGRSAQLCSFLLQPRVRADAGVGQAGSRAEPEVGFCRHRTVITERQLRVHLGRWLQPTLGFRTGKEIMSRERARDSDNVSGSVD